VRDVASLVEHASFLNSKAQFLLDAVLGIINVEQNAIIKTFTVASVALMPPTLIASIYGMNFRRHAELRWTAGYPFALVLMIDLRVLPVFTSSGKAGCEAGPRPRPRSGGRVPWPAATAAAEEPECPRTSPRVEVALDDPERSFRSRERDDAPPRRGGTRRAARRPPPRRHDLPGGVAERVEARLSVRPPGGVLRPAGAGVRSTLRHAEHRVRIAGELPRGSCLYRETEAHERRHVAVNRATLRRGRAEAEAAARRWAAFAVGRGHGAIGLAALREDLRRAITPAIDASSGAGRRAPRIDAPEEYERLGRVCPDEQRGWGSGGRRGGAAD
jgi:hypothetical protein